MEAVLGRKDYPLDCDYELVYAKIAREYKPTAYYKVHTYVDISSRLEIAGNATSLFIER
jgi:hypothetical protein